MHSWSILPNDLLSRIGKHLDTRIDVLRLRAVCPSWRSSIPHPHKSSPLFLMELPDPTRAPLSHPVSFTLTESTIYRLEPPDEIKDTYKYFGGWLVKAEEFEPGKFRHLNPLSQRQIGYNPKKFPKKLNLLDYHVFELSKAYKLDNYIAEKVIFSAEHSAVLVLYNGGRLALWRVRDEKWTQLHETCDDAKYMDHCIYETFDINYMDESYDPNYNPKYKDIMLYKGQFHAIDELGTLIAIDSSTLKITKVSQGLNNAVTGNKKHLLQSSGDLYVVERHLRKNEGFAFAHYFREKTFDFDIYKLNEVERDWVKVKNIEDQVMFLGDDCSFSSLAEELIRCRTNFIYFSDKMAFAYHSKRDDTTLKELERHESAMFNIEDRTICGIATGPRNFEVIWPPPGWLKLN